MAEIAKAYVLYKEVLGKYADQLLDFEGKRQPVLAIPPILFMGDYKRESLKKYPHISLLIEVFQMKAKVQPIGDEVIRDFMFIRPDLHEGVC